MKKEVRYGKFSEILYMYTYTNEFKPTTRESGYYNR